MTPSESVPSIPPSKMGIYLHECPEVLLEKLEQFLGVESRVLEKLSKLTPPINYKSYLSPVTKLQLLFYSPELVTYVKPVSGVQNLSNYNHCYFGLMVKLYYRLKPHLLVTFVDFIHHLAMETPGYERTTLKESYNHKITNSNTTTTENKNSAHSNNDLLHFQRFFNPIFN